MDNADVVPTFAQSSLRQTRRTPPRRRVVPVRTFGLSTSRFALTPASPARHIEANHSSADLVGRGVWSLPRHTNLPSLRERLSPLDVKIMNRQRCLSLREGWDQPDDGALCFGFPDNSWQTLDL